MKVLKFSSIFALVLLLSSCAALTQMQNFANCKFNLQNLDNLKVAGIALNNINQLSDLNIMDAARMTAVLATGGELPLTLTANVGVKNPNAEKASVTKLDWIVQIDGKDILEGSNSDRVEVEGNGGTATMPLNVTLDLKKIFEGKSKKDMTDLMFDLSGKKEKSDRIKLKVRPYFNIAGTPIALGYLTLSPSTFQ